jgi:DNA-binding beta-propeller fold protein YncE
VEVPPASLDLSVPHRRIRECVDRRDFLLTAAAAPLALRAGRRSAARQTLALVTCDTQRRIAVVDLASGLTMKSISVAAGPNSIQLVGGNAAVVCHTTVGAVTIIDGNRLEIRHVLDGFTEPRYTVAHPDGQHAFVTDSGTAELVSIDLASGRAIGRVKLGEWPRHITIDAIGRTAWVGLGNESEHLAIVDTDDLRRPRLERRVTPPFLAHDVGFLPGDREVWVTSGDTGAMALYDRGGELLTRLPADAAPQHVTFGGSKAYVASGYAGSFAVHSLADGRRLTTTRIPVGSFNVQAGFGHVLTPSLNDGKLSVLDPSGSLLTEAQVAPSCHDACFIRRS